VDAEDMDDIRAAPRSAYALFQHFVSAVPPEAMGGRTTKQGAMVM
jgi:hypothetical protein